MSGENPNLATGQYANQAIGSHRTGAEMKLNSAEVKRQVMAIVDDVQLRKWCVEQSVKYGPIIGVGPGEIAEDMYNFITNKENTDVQSS